MCTTTIIILSTVTYKRKNKITKAAGVAFGACFLLGCLFNYLSVILWAIVADNNSVCTSRFTFVALGYSLLLGSMFAKCWEISKILNQFQTGDHSFIEKLSWWRFSRIFIGVVTVELLLVIIWLSIDPPQAQPTLLDTIELLAEHSCSVNRPSLWMALHFSYFAIVLAWGAYLAYHTRDIWQKFNYPNESRSILLSIYNIGFCGLILIPLLTVLPGVVSSDTIFFIVSVAIMFPTTFALFCVYGPKMLSLLGSSIRGSQRKSQQGGTSKNEQKGQSYTAQIIKKEVVSEKEKEKEKEKDLEDPRRLPNVILEENIERPQTPE